MKTNKHKKPKIEFSKKIFYIVMTCFIAVIVYSMILMWKTNNTEPLSYLIPSVSGLAATAVGFYYWKARLENKIKLSKDYEISTKTIDQLDQEIKEEMGDNL